MIRYSLFLLVMAASSASFGFLGSGGGSLVGNGGDAIICKDSQGKIVGAFFFDLYEAKEKFQLTIIPPPGNTLEKKVHSLIDRVSGIDPLRAKVMKKWYGTLAKESFFKSGIKLVDIPDTGDAFWPQGCDLAQLVVQTEIDPPLKPYRYIFSEDIWKLLDDDNKAATIIHELLWREARMERHNTSEAIRYFNGLFQADAFKDMDRSQYFELLKKLRLSIATSLDGFPVGPINVFDGLSITNEFGKFDFKGNSSFDFAHSYGYSDKTDFSENLNGPLTLPPGLNALNLTTFRTNGMQGIEAYGRFYLPEFKLMSEWASYSHKTQAWKIATSSSLGLVIEFSKDRPRKVTILLNQNTYDIKETLTVITDYSTLEIKNNKLVSFTSRSNFIYKVNSDDIVCNGKFRTEVEEYKLSSCVLAKEFKIYQDGERLKFREGKRIYITSNGRYSKESTSN